VLLPIKDIVVKKRFRKGTADLNPLVKSLSEFGLLHPIVVDQNKVLIAGYRRLEAAKQLGWTHIEARALFMSNKKSRQAIEIEENNVRADFTKEEIEEALRVLSYVPWWKKLWNFILNLFRKSK
jgi:ParB family chromosome partitioning protein